jgi:hypothetical protein
VDAQTGLGPCWSQTHYVGFVVTWHIFIPGDNVFPVPYLREATCFDIGHVILKGKRSKLEKLTGVMTSSLPVGQLSDFVSVDRDREFMQKFVIIYFFSFLSSKFKAFFFNYF